MSLTLTLPYRPSGARRPRARAGVLALLLLGASAASAAAHDLWIEPGSWSPQAGGRIAVRLRVGQRFVGDPFPRDAHLIQRFVAYGPAGEVGIPGIDGGEPAGFLPLGGPGLYLLVYASHPFPIQLDAAKFEGYLAEEGLDAVSAERARGGRSGAPAKEIFSRCAKSLVAVGAGGPRTGFDRIAGLRLELVPERDPLSLAPGEELPVKLLYGGKPLRGAKVAALPRTAPAEAVSARTDAAGEVHLRLGRPGVWLLKAVHMIAAPPGSPAEWESFWASVTFQLPPR
jgi:hypothetical protein